MKKLLVAAALAVCASASFASIVNLSAGSSTPNAGPNSGTYAYNPVTLTLSAGDYTVREVGGAFSAYSVSTPPTGNWTDAYWSYSYVSNGTTITNFRQSIGRFDTAADALAAYSALAPLTFTLTQATTVSFYVDDSANPYFADDTGGVSLAVTNVPEPGTTSLVGLAAIGLALTRRRSRASK